MLPTRKVTSAPKGPVPARACTGRRRARGHRRAVDRVSAVCRACAADLPSRAGLPTFRIHRPDRPDPAQHVPPLPAAPTSRLGPSARRQAEAPGELPARFGRPGELIVHTEACTGVVYSLKPSRAPEQRPRMPEPRERPGSQALRGTSGAPGVRQRAASGAAKPRSSGTRLGPRDASGRVTIATRHIAGSTRGGEWASRAPTRSDSRSDSEHECSDWERDWGDWERDWDVFQKATGIHTRATRTTGGDSRNRLGARGGNSPGRLGHQGGDSLAPLGPSPLARRPRRSRLAPATLARRGRLARSPLPRAPPLPLRSLPTAKRRLRRVL